MLNITSVSLSLSLSCLYGIHTHVLFASWATGSIWTCSLSSSSFMLNTRTPTRKRKAEIYSVYCALPSERERGKNIRKRESAEIKSFMLGRSSDLIMSWLQTFAVLHDSLLRLILSLPHSLSRAPSINTSCACISFLFFSLSLNYSTALCISIIYYPCCM